MPIPACDQVVRQKATAAAPTDCPSRRDIARMPPALPILDRGALCMIATMFGDWKSPKPIPHRISRQPMPAAPASADMVSIAASPQARIVSPAPPSAPAGKGVMLITLEDETGIANLVVWPKVFEAHRRIILGAGMIAVRGRVQREGEVVHHVAHGITDLSRELGSVGEREQAFPLPHGRGDEFHHGAPGPDPRATPKGLRTRDMYIRDLHLDAIRVKTRDFR